MGKGKVIGAVAAAVVIPAAAVVGAIYILPLLNINVKQHAVLLRQ